MKDIEVRQTWKCDSCGTFEEEVSNKENVRTSNLPDSDWSEICMISSESSGVKADLCPKCTQVIHKYKGNGFKSLPSHFTPLAYSSGSLFRLVSPGILQNHI